MIMLHILLECPDCKDRTDDQPNYCRTCGGRGMLKTVISEKKLAGLAEIPRVLGAWTEVRLSNT